MVKSLVGDGSDVQYDGFVAASLFLELPLQVAGHCMLSIFDGTGAMSIVMAFDRGSDGMPLGEGTGWASGCPEELQSVVEAGVVWKGTILMAGDTMQELDDGKVTYVEIMEWNLWVKLGHGAWVK